MFSQKNKEFISIRSQPQGRTLKVPQNKPKNIFKKIEAPPEVGIEPQSFFLLSRSGDKPQIFKEKTEARVAQWKRVHLLSGRLLVRSQPRAELQFLNIFFGCLWSKAEAEKIAQQQVDHQFFPLFLFSRDTKVK